MGEGVGSGGAIVDVRHLVVATPVPERKHSDRGPKVLKDSLACRQVNLDRVYESISLRMQLGK